MSTASNRPRLWVCGGTTGIGAATVTAAARLGFDAIGTSAHTGEDVRSQNALDQFVIGANASFPITHAVYAAGINRLDWIENTNGDEVLDLLNVNVVGFQRFLAALLNYNTAPAMRICVVTSDAATRPLRTSLAYCASKAALEAAVRVAARELGPRGHRINAVAPGMTDDTGMTGYVDGRVPEVRGWTSEEALAYEMQQAVIKRRARPEEIADTIMSVLQLPDYVNGASVVVNGGR